MKAARVLHKMKKAGVGYKTVIYVLLIGIGFVYLYPLLYMLINSFMSTEDLIDPTVSWIPTTITFDNFRRAVTVLEYGKSLFVTIGMSVGPALLQTISLAVISYGLARFDIPLKKMWMVLIIAVFIIPTQVTMIPQYVMFKSYGFADTPLPSYVPALFGQGIKSSIFILIFHQFFKSYPNAFDEAASIDGAGPVSVFFHVSLYMVGPAILVCFLFSFIWYWNETLRSGLFFGTAIQTLPMRIQNFVTAYSQYFSTDDFSTTNRLNEAIRLAGTLLTVLPLMAVYLALQRYFIEGIERAGITGE